jgi:hypothetical protein
MNLAIEKTPEWIALPMVLHSAVAIRFRAAVLGV